MSSVIEFTHLSTKHNCLQKLMEFRIKCSISRRKRRELRGNIDYSMSIDIMYQNTNLIE